MKKVFLFLFFLIYVLDAKEIELVKGQVLFLDFNKSDFFKFYSKNKSISHFVYDDKVVVSIAMPYKNPKDMEVLVEFKDNHKEKFYIKATDGFYKKETLKVNASKVNPPKEVLNRIEREYQEATKIYNFYTDKFFFDGKFIYPLTSKITSDFGKARIFNNTLKSYHSGADFRANIGTQIQASNSGIVKIASNRYYAGWSVVVDHGYGIYSQYYHLSELFVREGQKINKGEIIGLSGASGRVTGPHLHFGVVVNGIQVDPLDFIIKFNKL
ncbi:peptidase, M23/M37 family [Campylobacter insulaenigrae]|uniref:M23 family metallopeptidase n=1 Tax=Campylobacter insulaenigrae TaxID=260714 RepID=UPI000F6D4ABB|nr:M23 family metallopeptidase [Campylobacter insulaenigrae]MCR6591235.1 M23 family metallopeptidase [Campylobacter insulaenigrae]MCR6592631.1 M23 family metallopeptidase [Campylobacter insulaenigrae]VEJ53134.1 peptidase, M23/M37 family [Campylobacter insulaenigrae]